HGRRLRGAAPAGLPAARPGRPAADGGPDLLRRVRLPPQALRRLRDAAAPVAGVRQRRRLAGLGPLVLRAGGDAWLSGRGPGTCCDGPGGCTPPLRAPCVGPPAAPGGAGSPPSGAGCSGRWPTCAAPRPPTPWPA